jgi:hypothetical protein
MRTQLQGLQGLVFNSSRPSGSRSRRSARRPAGSMTIWNGRGQSPHQQRRHPEPAARCATMEHAGQSSRSSPASRSHQLTTLSDMLKQVLDCMRTFSEAPPAPIYQAPLPYGYGPVCAATHPVHGPPSTPPHWHPPARVNPRDDPRTGPAPTPPVVSQTDTPAPLTQ